MKSLTIEDLHIALTKFCLEKNITVTRETIKANAARLTTRYSPNLCISVLHDLVFETNRFPDASIIAAKINEKIGFNFDVKSEATKEAGRIITAIHNCGFQSSDLKNDIGEDLYNLIGGSEAIVSFSTSSQSHSGIFKAQIRDAITDYTAKKKRQECFKMLAKLNENPELAFNNNKQLEQKRNV